MKTLVLQENRVIFTVIKQRAYHYVNVQDGEYAECQKEDAIGVFLEDKNMIVPTEYIFVDVEDIPDGVVTGKYCYAEEDGFYLDPNWKEPPRTPEQLDEAFNEMNLHQTEVELDVDFRLSNLELNLHK
ncbi:MAG: hypothetical protein E6600_06815 [Anaerocolumna aminovalerica]|uniref:hypothetical protein n=1 Tax=Anaerocolumna aminovalerica TaxID=1527 RepID=UPI000BE29DB5|nr:hypothetical protein [Anaerocolumna aminovalerica]MDU6264200.1 hypothetical protein [Anaerocolumna aminovalerica]